MFSLQPCLGRGIEWFLLSLVTIVSSMLSSMLDIITISFVYSQLEEEEDMTHSDYDRLLLSYTTTAFMVIFTRMIRNIVYISSHRGSIFGVSLLIWISACLVNLGAGLAAFIQLEKSPISTVLFVSIWITILIISHFIDLVVIGVKMDPRQRPLWLLLAKKQRLSRREECFICTEEYTNSIELECGHHVHEECLERWALQGRQNCPLCRSEIV